MKKVTLLLFLLLALTGCEPKEDAFYESEKQPIEIEENSADIKIVDESSSTRPFAVVVNNSPVAVKVQTGLQSAYMVYEIPVEGGLTRLLAFYKDVEDITIGTIRSARHNFLDYAFESDAIFVHFGWSHYAKDDIKSTGINNINGLSDSAFWRENPENLPSEHTAYTSISKIKNNATQKGNRLTTEKKILLNYSGNEVSLEDRENSTKASKLVIPSNINLDTSYQYDAENKVYKRFVNGNPHIDYKTKEQYTAKNIIVQKINTKVADDGKYWDLETTGSGEGYYITNGYSVPITWKKENRMDKTYYYFAGEEIVVNDGNTFIQLQSTNQKFEIE